jgi:hypothetical protein
LRPTPRPAPALRRIAPKPQPFFAVTLSIARARHGEIIHHLVDQRKRVLYRKIFGLLNSHGVFCNLEHVASATELLHVEVLEGMGFTVETEDPSNKLLGVETQLGWLREIGFVDVDCQWKWRELALLTGTRG